MPVGRIVRPVLGLLLMGALAGCGQQYAVLDPAGPVGASELHLIVLSSLAMAIVIAFVYVVFVYVIWRFRERPGREAPYVPDWSGDHRLEILWFIIPAVLLTVIAVPTVQETYALAQIPPARHRVVIDVTSFDWKWLFQYPAQHVATVNYAVIPTRVPVLFRLTANSPMNAFWVPRLGGMEYAMPNRVLPLWLEATRPGVFLGRNANFSGIDYWRMTFQVHAVPPARFATWIRHVKKTKPRMSEGTWRALAVHGLAIPQAYSSYPPNTFPSRYTQFTIHGLYYSPTKKP